VQAEEWHSEQQGTINEDGSYTLEFPYSDERELLGDILRFGADVEVLGPPSLRQSTQRAVEQLSKLYALDSP
jgi:predicted DNA-binding transcriptional regulator YafY